MADAPSGGGGSSWGAFEVILSLLLAVGLLSNISGKPIKSIAGTGSSTNKETSVPKEDESSKRCGLSIATPLSMESVSGSVRLSGSVSGCRWELDGNKALFAQVVSGSGVPISDFVTIERNPNDILRASFDKIININGNPAGIGYLLLMPAIQQDPEKPITVRVPLKFVRR